MLKDKKLSAYKPSATRIRARFVAISWRDLAVSFGPFILLILIGAWLVIWLIRPAPPSDITIAAGPKDSNFWRVAERYRDILARDGIKLKLVETGGSLDNLKRLADSSQEVDVGFVQGGLAGAVNADALSSLVSLGSISYVPVSVYYRSPPPREDGRPAPALRQLSELAGKRIAIGGDGSGSSVLAATLLKANGVEQGGGTELLNIGGDEAAQALTSGKIDAAFLMGDSVSLATMGKLLRAPGIRLLDFSQADAYVRRYRYLNILKMPMGVFDLARNLPARDTQLIAPTAELVAREDLHPALSDLLIEAAHEVHGKANVMQKAGEFPAPLEHEYRVSDDAQRYYKSGKTFFYRTLPFWLASLVDRAVVILLPVILLLIPGIRLVPMLYGWRIRSRIYRMYGELIALERGISRETPEDQAEILKRLDEIEAAVNRMKMPLAFADQFYVLREHIGFVRARLEHHAVA
ncbi:TAXI family TRAP transporter solute-binding subunit [Herbaspirillum robiniae]|uniref:ABC transporter substrate-binding protein n=1 Tax=Herbaspirillum robiniae TaxID=2014887 RepID=A0A246WTP2_9BURK|nr:TAXI family TRAP transporter solute-binding subunit [Herbaspirillum robiniae]NUU01179.1 ABC transporter substrate-binding protein [Herbaspirillum robiniae]OWY30329.1 C4-dicarboxylate ABC transporter substrate-binding protein [Herbaspirillum robiniae]